MPLVDEKACVKDGEMRIQAGRSAGYIYYGQPAYSTSTVPSSASPLITSDYSTIPVSSSGFGHGVSREVVWGGRACPWTLAALPGQRIRLRVIVINHWDDPVTDGESLDAGGGSDTCPETLVVEESVLTSTVHLPVCRGRQRDSQIYLSIGHRLSIHVEQSGVHAVRHRKTGEMLQHSPTSTMDSRRSGFLLTYECQ